MADHTPGPWKWWTSNSLMRLTADRGRDGGVLSAVRRSDGFADIEVSDANARLIAAAPDLMEVVQALITCADEDFIANTSHQDSLGVLADAARAAIAKATEMGNG